MKKVLSFLLALTMIFTMISVGIISVSAYQSGDYTYDLVGESPDQTATITGYTGTDITLEIPGSLDGYTVTGIDARVFENRMALHTVTIPDSVIDIGENAFNGCNNLSVLNIGSGFYPEYNPIGLCPGLTQINIDEDNEYLSSQDGVLFDKEGTYLLMYPCGRTGSYEIAEGVTNIDDGAFYGCTGLTGFSVDEGNDYFSSREGVLFNKEGTTLIKCPASKTVSSEILEGVTYINTGAFYGCTGLTGITIPSTVTTIDSDVFTGCSSLAAINVSQENPSYKDIDGVLFNKEGTQLLAYPNVKGNSYNIPHGVQYIHGAFSGCSALTSITIPETVIYIDGSSFYQCVGLTSVIIPDSVTNIDYCAFNGCTQLEDVYFLGNAPSSMGDAVFSNCAAALTLNYISGSTGFTNPWYDYASATFEPLAAPTLTATPVTLTSGNVTVTISYPTAAVKVYRTSLGDWTVYDTEHPVTLSVNDTVYAKYMDANGKPSLTGSISVSNISFGDYLYSVNGSAATITGYLGSGGNLTIPGTLNGHTVTGIGTGAFGGCTGLTSVTIPNKVKNIADQAFDGCTNLTAANFRGEAPTMGTDVFDDCASAFQVNYINGFTGYTNTWHGYTAAAIQVDNFTYAINSYFLTIQITGYTGTGGHVTIPSELLGYPVTEIGADAFNGCTALTGVTIPNSIIYIDYDAFYGCAGLAGITIPASVENIGSNAFSNCTSLTSVNIPSKVYYIGSTSFSGCSSLTSINVSNGNPYFSSENGVLFNKTQTTLISYPAGKAGGYLIPESVTNIGEYSFRDCHKLSFVIIPNNVTSIGMYAFNYCTGLAGVTLSSNLTSIGDGAFNNCTSLTSIVIPAGISSISWNTFFNCTSLKKVTIPNSVTSIGSYAFCLCTSLTEINIPDSVTSIGSSAFSCTGLTEVTIPDSITTISDGTFAGCSSLSKVNIPNSVTNIEMYAFMRCTNLTCITIPDSVTNIGVYAFFSCTGMKSVIFGDHVTSIGGSAFENCSHLTNVTFPKSVNYIGNYSFASCTQMESIAIGSGVTAIDVSAFTDCGNLKSVSFYGTAPAMGSDVFNRCPPFTIYYLDGNTGFSNPWQGHPTQTIYSSDFIYTVSNSKATIDGYIGPDAEHIILPSELGGYPVTAIGAFAFNNAALTDVVIPDGVTSIGAGAFNGCTDLAEVTIPCSVTSIGTGAFNGCTALEEINIPKSVTSIGEHVFDGCTGLSAVNIPSSVTGIGACAFKGCVSLTEIHIPDSVTSLGAGAFSGCTGLAKIIIPKNITNISASTFSNCTALSSVIIPENIESIGNNAFKGCTSLENAYFVYLTENAPVMGTGVFPASASFTLYYISGNESFDEDWNVSGYAMEPFTLLDAPTLEASETDPTDENVAITITSPVEGALIQYKIGSGNWTPYTEAVTISANDTVYARYKDADGKPSETGSTVVSNITFMDFTYCITDADTATITGYIGNGSSLVIPGNIGRYTVTGIAEDAFKENTNIIDTYIPSSITSIGNDAFEGCSSLCQAYFPGDAPALGSNVFAGCHEGFTVYHGSGTGFTNPWHGYTALAY